MILQKLAKALRRQDWFQVVIEVLIVIVGIFLGLQVQEWNEQRIERNEEVLYLDRLLNETKASLATNEEAIDIAYGQWQEAYFVAGSLKTCALDDQDKDRFARGLWFAGKVQSIELSKTVVDELKATGKYQILRNVTLRDALTDLESIYTNAHEVNTAVYATMVFHASIIDSSYSIEMDVPDPTFPFLDFGWADTNIDFEKLCASDQFKNSLNHMMRYVNTYVGLSQRVLNKQRDVIKILNQSLEQNP